MGDDVHRMPRSGTRSILGSGRVSCSCLRKMHFPGSGIAANALSFAACGNWCATDRKNARFFLWASLAALGVASFPGVSLSWRSRRFPALRRHREELAAAWRSMASPTPAQIMPTLSRLPGYPAFLAAIFAVFGVDNFRAVLLVQVLFDLATCFLIADMARRLFFRARRAGGLSAGRLVSVPRELCGRRTDRNSGDLFYGSGTGPGIARAWALAERAPATRRS